MLLAAFIGSILGVRATPYSGPDLRILFLGVAEHSTLAGWGQMPGLSGSCQASRARRNRAQGAVSTPSWRVHQPMPPRRSRTTTQTLCGSPTASSGAVQSTAE